MLAPLETQRILARKIARSGKSLMGFRVRSIRGFTIIEVMIFLIVSVVVFGAAVTTISRQNARTSFEQSVKDVETTLQDVFNDVEDGYYPSKNNFTCTANASGVNINSAGSTQQGKNEGCIFIGKAIQFGRNGQKDRLAVSTIIGKRLNTDETDVTNFIDAKPTLLETDGLLSQKDTRYISADVQITGFHLNNLPGVQFSGMAVLSGFAKQSGGSLQSGIVRTSLFPLGLFSGGVGSSDSSFLADVENLKTLNPETAIGQFIEARGAVLCLEEAGGGRKAEIKIAVESQRLSTDTVVYPSSGVCA